MRSSFSNEAAKGVSLARRTSDFNRRDVRRKTSVVRGGYRIFLRGGGGGGGGGGGEEGL